MAEDFGSLAILRSLEEIDGRHRVKDTKTPKRRHLVVLSSFASVALRGHKALREAEGNCRDDGPVFCDAQGGYLRRSNVIRNDWAPLLKKAKLPPLRMYNLRHSCALLLLGAGERQGGQRAPGPRLHLDHPQHLLPPLADDAGLGSDGPGRGIVGRGRWLGAGKSQSSRLGG